MKVSVIIPVYNVRPYLERCIQSVLNQTYKDVEVILVDDGSTDGSGELCDELALNNQHIRVIHQANQGISGARNAGLLQAEGQYIAFLDADDAWLLPDGLEQILNKAEVTVADIVIFKAVHIFGGGRKNYTQDYDVEYIETLPDSSAIFSHLVYTQQFSMSACFLLVRRKLLVDHDIFFPLGYISEDVFWSIHLWQYIQTVVILNLDFYGYYHRGASVTSTPSLKVYESYDNIFSYWKDQCEKGCKNADAIRAYLADMWINRGYCYGELNSIERKKAIKVLKQHADLLKYANTSKSVRVSTIVRVIGVKNTAVILGWYWHLRSIVKK